MLSSDEQQAKAVEAILGGGIPVKLWFDTYRGRSEVDTFAHFENGTWITRVDASENMVLVDAGMDHPAGYVGIHVKPLAIRNGDTAELKFTITFP